MKSNIATLLNRAIGCKYEKEALQLIRVAAKALEEEIQADDENRAFQERAARQPFEGAYPLLRNYPF